MKLNVQHIYIRSTDAVDTLIENRIIALQPRLQIEEANVRLEHRREISPAFRVHVHLVTPAPRSWQKAEITRSVPPLKRSWRTWKKDHQPLPEARPAAQEQPAIALRAAGQMKLRGNSVPHPSLSPTGREDGRRTDCIIYNQPNTEL